MVIYCIYFTDAAPLVLFQNVGTWKTILVPAISLYAKMGMITKYYVQYRRSWIDF